MSTLFFNLAEIFSDRLTDRIRTASEALRCGSPWASLRGSQRFLYSEVGHSPAHTQPQPSALPLRHLVRGSRGERFESVSELFLNDRR